MENTEQNAVKILPFESISQVASKSINYIKARKNHSIVSLKTRWDKFNKATGGIEPNMIFTIAGISGSGKSSVANMLVMDLIDLNPNQDIVVLYFSLEMVDYRNVGRVISNKTKKTVGNTIDYFHNTVANGRWLIVVLDHVLLVNGESGERSTIVDLQKMFIQKKKLSNTSIIQLSQMNRNIESPDRINNPSTHFPMRSDLSASDAIFQASDFVIAVHRPEILNLAIYGVRRLPVKNKVYMHFLKVRDGEPCILEFENELQYGNLVETNTASAEEQKVVFKQIKKG